jgi:hypothetical protein
MKLWQLDSILQGNRSLPATVAASNKEWHYLTAWFNEMDKMDEIREKVSSENKNILDSYLPSEFVIAVLNEVDQYYFLSNDGWLRSWCMNPDDKKISFVDCFKKYGGEILEDVGEKGSFHVG